MKSYSIYAKGFSFCGMLKLISIPTLLLYSLTAISQTNDSTKQAIKKLHRSQLYLKNNFFIGASFGASNREIEDLDLQFFTIENLNRSRSTVRFEAGYFIKNNWALGIASRYGRSSANVNFLSAEGTPTAYQAAAERYSFYLTSKNFVPLGSESRFIVFANSMIGALWRNQVSETLSAGLLQRSFSNSKQAELVIQPGISFNIIRGLNIELAMEFASLGGEWSQSYLNGEATSSSERFRGNFSFNILRTDFGIFYYFNTYAKRGKYEK